MTAVEWFDQKLQEFAGFQSWSPDKSIVIKLIIPVSEYNNLKEQAKEMEKQQITDAYESGEDNVDNDGCTIGRDGAKTYYNETYGSKGSDNLPKVQNKDSFGEISDEEIEKAADKYVSEDEFNRYLKCFEDGAKWYREQLKQRQ